MFDNKSQIPLLKVLYVLVLTGILFILFMIYLFQASNIPQREETYKHSIIISNFLNSQCIIENKINIEDFSEERINNCIDVNQFSASARISIINNEAENTINPLIIIADEGSSQPFSDMSSFCGITRTQTCSIYEVPVLVGEEERFHTLRLEIIT